MSEKRESIQFQYDTEPKPLNETADCPGVYVCVKTGHYFQQKRYAASFGVEHGFIKENSGGESRDEAVWMKRPAPPHNKWRDPYVEQANPRLEDAELVPGTGSASRRVAVKQGPIEAGGMQ